MRDLIARFVGTVTAGRSYDAFDEEDAYVQVQRRVVLQVGEEMAVEAAVLNLKMLAAEISRKMAISENLASPTEIASLSMEMPPGEVEEEGGIVSKYLVVSTHKGRCVRLHLAYGCWRARQRSFAVFEYIDQDPAPREMYNAICRDCWPGRSGDDLTAADGDADMGDSDSSATATGESS